MPTRPHSVEEIQLNNGARGLFIHVPGATVMNYELNFRAGEYLIADRHKWETAHLMEHVILGANRRYRDARKFSAEFQKNGAYFNAYTSYYSIGYVGEAADFEWERVLKLQLLSLSQPLFLQKEFKAEWGNIHDELISYHNNHFRHLGGRLSQSFGINHPTDIERSELMKHVRRADLVEHYQRTHFAGNLRFIVAGNLRGRKQKLTAILEHCGLPSDGARFELPMERAEQPHSPVFISNETVQNIYLYIISCHNDYLTDDRNDALRHVKVMHTDTLHSKIFGAAREKGLVYTVNSGHTRAKTLTEWWLNAQVLPEKAPALCQIVLDEIGKVKRGRIEDDDLQAVRQYAMGQFQRSLQTVGSITDSYGRYFFDGVIEDLDQVPDRIMAVTKNSMAEAVNFAFDGGIGSVGVLGGTDHQIAEKLYQQLQPLWD